MIRVSNFEFRISTLALALAIILTLTLALPTRAQTPSLPWHAPGWAYRALVQADSSAHPDVDVAAIRIVHLGAAAPTGNDYRIFDSAGHRVPYEITYHDPARDTLISFRCPSAGGTFAIYWGNPSAPVDGMRAIDPATPGTPGGLPGTLAAIPGSGPPKPGPDANGWIPHAGLVLATLRRPHPPALASGAPRPDNPESVPEMAALIAHSPEPDGAGYVPNISDGFNRFGDSDWYISIYRGWINLPAAGTYGFCTASNESSFSFMDGKDLVHWPGRHTEDRGRHGEKNVVRAFTAGLHYVEYYHEEVLLYQMAFLGYRPPGHPLFIGIPNSLFPEPQMARLLAVQDAQQHRLITPVVNLMDSYWPPDRAEGQLTRFSFTADAGVGTPLTGWNIQWSFGDGLTATGSAVEHVYLTLGTYKITMTATGPPGDGSVKVVRSWPKVVYLIDVANAAFRNGSAGGYEKLVQDYDRARLATPSLVELARLQALTDARDDATKSAQAALTRADISPEDLADMNVTIAAMAAPAGPHGSALSGSAKNPEQARLVADHLRAALAAEKDPTKRLLIAARAIRTVGIDEADVKTAELVYAAAELDGKKAFLDRHVKEAFRQATIAIGDAHLAARQLDKANEDYRTAEALAQAPIPQQVRVAKIGSYPEAIEQRIRANRIDEAMAVARRWQDELPSDQINGTVLFYIGKLERLQTRPAAAIRPLQLSIELAQGAEFEAEARWLLAESYHDMGDEDGRRRALTALIRSGLSGEFRLKALDAIKEMGGLRGPTEVTAIRPSTRPATPK